MKKVVIYPIKEILYGEVMDFVRSHAPKRYKYSNEFYRKEDRYNSAVAYVLLCIAYGKIIPEFEVGRHGKPYFKSSTEYFSISHSKNIITIVISDNEVAIDCEFNEFIDESIVNNTFTKDEKKLVENRSINECIIWTAKEAISKFWNEDWYSYPRTDITVDNGQIYDKNNLEVFLEFIDLENCSVCIASRSTENPEICLISESVLKEMID